MELEKLKKRFETLKLSKYLEQLDETTEEEFWDSIVAIKEIFPNADIYHAGSSKFGYLGVGIKPSSDVRVKEFTLVCLLNENCDEEGNYYIEYGIIEKLYTYIKSQDAQVPQSFEPVKLQFEEFKDWLKQIKKHATEFGFELNGQALLPSDYKEDFSFTTEEAYQYLTRRYQVIEVEKENKKIVGFRNTNGRECALNLEVQNPSIFIGIDPENNNQFSFRFLKKQNGEIAKYLEHEGRHSGLKNNAPSLYTGHKAFSISLNTFKDLEKFCDWYEQSDDQTTLLERKVKAFLELWPVERLKNLTIEDYHQAKNTDSFISQVDCFDPTQGDPTFACYFDFWEPIGLGNNEKYHNEKPYSWHKRLGDDPELAFQQIKQEILDIIDAVQHRDLTAIDQIQFTKGLKWMIAFLYQDFSNPCVIPIVTETNIKRIGYESYLKTPLPEFLPILIKNQGNQSFFPYVEKLFTMVRKGYLANKQKKQKNEEIKGEVMMEQALNRILFGAAGTGKTYHTINHAVSILDPEYDPQLDRKELKKRFDIYKKQGQIQFVTFHQSFSYEDFVEGIRAETDDTGKLTYDVQSGVFKEICEKAKGTAQQKHHIDEVVDDFLAEITETPLELKTQQNKQFTVAYLGSGLTLQCQPLASEVNATYYANIGKIKSLLSGEEVDKAYNRSYIKAVAEYLKPRIQKQLQPRTNQSYVLIIDEINRGNISRIFGELITLIEDSKRQGADEALSVTLPYSKEEFSVPNNVYIIGTMNSSDRSLTGLDIALRRRFTFIEMPPQPQEIKNEDGELIKISGKDKDGNDKDVIVADILSVMNQRIEVLLDRDHCIGHANFMSLKEKPTLEHLAHIFKQKIIPQLQEYFFDDWAKINLVFFNNSMIVEDKDINIAGLFPSKFEQELGYSNEKKIWKINDDAFKTIDAFIQILGSKE